MKTSLRGLLEICEHEGIVPAPYRDSVGVFTWGIGHTSGAGDPDPIKMARAMPADVESAIDRAVRQFQIDVAKYEARVNEAIKVPLKQHQFDALVSFDLNTGGIYRAVLTREINAGNPNASAHFMGWLKPPEIRKRRTAEKRLFETGNYDANGDDIAVWKTNGAGRLTGILRTINGNELAERLGQPKPTTPDDALASHLAATEEKHAALKADIAAILEKY